MTDTIRLYHNARCSKSRSACALLADKGVPTTIIEYLKTPPTREELAAVLAALGMRAEDLVRKGEDVFKATFKGRTLSEDEWLDALVAHPILIERPIAVRGARAVVGRPPEKVLELL
ncbi:MAG TPA: arsenate reductase (glutaredoxin) [Zoogloea sp.]|uniref:arsenate reductase (glutaredoxin) n=1 Tax=Zoogloea sp. TaxID=49181 RepID=UPI002BB00236|nr:arsenate reductase (glutaredoxin) [Zoogloea sp.]HMV17316.1 arsenate reductase (glutaredoxin) [Rhodocyclaceae bacterium]HMV62383.1 arsenate reductase (glutaredoxin) [Rhodocyclaceae bacterium]HMW50986.1 arsenate reductase (glutaredoxin) [Rhodocyclaceae bacterium]HMY49124.1 arsenate reductase (glutaredoxin) [Rhodocyclaceae bacterium]HMZ75635.1 arsenate reductase (glutaredoxin) [Rhodocyclaceae bacterium]